jgi:hypothetical protein
MFHGAFIWVTYKLTLFNFNSPFSTGAAPYRARLKELACAGFTQLESVCFAFQSFILHI